MADEWKGIHGELALAVEEQRKRLRETYLADPARLEQDANIERSIVEGAYANRQLFELIQNAADAISQGAGAGRCELVLTDHDLYAANTGAAVTVEGVEALMATHRSAKRDDQIGRFGLGFKSVLAVSDCPRVFSRSGSFVFDRARSGEELSALVPGALHYPATRLAWAADPHEWARKDLVLRSMMKWASTVVVLPLKAHRDVLAKGLKLFPAEFLLFSPQVQRLDLEDRSAGTGRSISLSTTPDGDVVLDDASRKSTWVVTRASHDPSKAALDDGGYHAARQTLDVAWAAPVSGTQASIGTFWSYFPTTSLTTLSGIVNAPWKLAEDRETLLPGAFNDELLRRVLPSLVTKALPAVFRSSRPGAVIDVLPARGREARNHADDVLNEPVMRAVSSVPSIPTLANKLVSPRRARLHPDGLSEEHLKIWADACPDPEIWVHHALAGTERRSKVVRLMGYHNRSAVSLREWVEHLVKTPTVERSAAAVRLVSSLLPTHREAADLAKARVLLMADGTLQACTRGQVFLPGGGMPEGALTIDPVLAGDPDVVKALGTMGIEVFDTAGELLSELARKPIMWDRVWPSSRKVSLGEAERLFRDSFGESLLTDIRVRTYSGKWQPPNLAFLPGEVIPGDGSRDVDFLVDPRYHRQDIELLERLGLVSSPRRTSEAPPEAWRSALLQEARETYRRQQGNSRLADENIVVTGTRVTWPLDALPLLTRTGAAALTSAALRQLSGDEVWRLSRTDGRGPTGHVDDGIWRFLRRHGFLPTLVGLQPVARCIAFDETEATQDGVEQPLPFERALLNSDQVRKLKLHTEVGELRGEDWRHLLKEANGWEPERRYLLYAWAAYCDQPAPIDVRVSRGPGHVETGAPRVAATSSAETFQSLLRAKVPALFLTSEDDVEILRNRWGMKRGEDMLVETVSYDVAGESVLAVDRFPPLRNYLAPEWGELAVQQCVRLELQTSTPDGRQTRPLTERLEGLILYTTAADDRALLAQIVSVTGSGVTPDRVLRSMEEQRLNKLRQAVLEAQDLPTKLVLAIGADNLRRTVPDAVLDAVAGPGRQLAPDEIARLALAVDGYAILQNNVASLNKKKLQAPKVWAGRRPAREWVRSLGFPIEFAGFAGETRAAEMEVDGPPILGELHEYQRRIAANVQGLLDPDTEVNRGLLSLPTGAGKTRVAVQALVEHMAAAGRGMRIVWLAETDELCEQATQTWAQVWRAKGRPGLSMTLSRLWQSNEPNEREGHQVVVASLAQLQSILRADGSLGEYDWLRHPDMIVVDEAHRSISPKYTEVISALGGTKRVAEIRTPLLGLTATPFRGFNEVETTRLADRYHNNLLDEGVFPGDDVYAYLQDMEVLSRVRHRELQGAEIELSASERKELENMRRLPSTAGDRLGQNRERTAEIVQAVLDLEKDKTVLLFATSVENAEVIAALLTHNGVEARAISSNSDAFMRRRYVQDFREKKIRVLTNFNVFTEGFDVPKVDAVFITRPTFSPNVYQQMIGRGLRGPRNGGNSEVLIVNVADNIANYGHTLAFRHFEHLWNRGQGTHA